MPVGLAPGWGQAKPKPGTPINRAHPITDGLVAAIAFNNQGGPAVESISGMRLALKGTAGWYANGLQCDAAGEGAEILAPAYLKLGFPITIIWSGRYLGSNDVNAGLFGLTYDNADGSPYVSYGFVWHNSGTIIALWGANNGNGGNAATANAPAAGPMWLCGTIASGAQALYINNASVAAATQTQSTAPSSSATSLLYTGNHTGFSRNSQVRAEYGYIWNRILTLAEREYIKAYPAAPWSPPAHQRIFVIGWSGGGAISVSLAGAMPAATGALTRIEQASRSLAGSAPASSATLTQGVHATARALAGTQPAAGATLTQVAQALRSLAGEMSAATGALTRMLAALRSPAGSNPAASAVLTNSVHATARVLAGSQPTATAVLTRIAQPFRSIAGVLPSAAAILTRHVEVSTTLTGSLAAPTATMERLMAALRSLAGADPSSTADLIGEKQGGGTYYRTLDGNLPSAAAALTRHAETSGAVAGSQPSPTATLTRQASVSVALAGIVPAAAAVLSRLLQAARALTGNEPTATAALGVVAGTHAYATDVAGTVPAPTGELSRQLTAIRGVEGEQPAASAGLARRIALFRTVTGAMPAPTSTLDRLYATVRLLDGALPSPTGGLIPATNPGLVVISDSRRDGVLVADRRASPVTTTDTRRDGLVISDYQEKP